jgi:hypothetical protein
MRRLGRSPFAQQLCSALPPAKSPRDASVLSRSETVPTLARDSWVDYSQSPRRTAQPLLPHPGPQCGPDPPPCFTGQPTHEYCQAVCTLW